MKLVRKSWRYACVEICPDVDFPLHNMLRAKAELAARRYGHTPLEEFHVSIHNQRYLKDHKEEFVNDEIQLRPSFPNLYHYTGHAFQRSIYCSKWHDPDITKWFNEDTGEPIEQEYRESSYIRFEPESFIDLIPWFRPYHTRHNKIQLHISLSNLEGNKFKSIKDPYNGEGVEDINTPIRSDELLFQ